MATKKQVAAVLKEIDAKIAPLEAQRLEFEKARLATCDFDDKNYYSGVEQKFQAEIDMIISIKKIITKHLVKK